MLLVVYIHLWILEGAIRKWIPGTEQILYVFRDAVTLLALIYLGKQKNWKYRRAPILWSLIITFTIFCLITSFINTSNLPVIFFGIRGYLAPLIFAYAVWSYGNPDMILPLAKTILLYAPIQGILSVSQVLSSPDSIINKQVGTDSAHFVNGEVVRTSGTFSAPAGLALYITLALAIALWMLASKIYANRYILLSQALVIVVAVMLSGSRGVLASTAIVMSAYFIAQIRKSPLVGLYTIIMGTIAIVLGIMIVFQFFPGVYESFNNRIVDASQQENSAARIWEQTFGFWNQTESIFGSGPGSHSQIGIALGSRASWVEIDSIKWVKELGVVGFALAVGRLLWVSKALIQLLFSPRNHYLLKYLICAVLLPIIVSGSITQFPSSQAAVSICIGLLILDRRSQQRLD